VGRYRGDGRSITVPQKCIGRLTKFRPAGRVGDGGKKEGFALLLYAPVAPRSSCSRVVFIIVLRAVKAGSYPSDRGDF